MMGLTSGSYSRIMQATLLEKAVSRARLGFFLAGLLLFGAGLARAQYIPPYVNLTGPLSSSNGMPAQNYVITFQPNQIFYIGGTSVVVSGSTCGTDNSGQVVGLRNPLTVPITAVVTGTGTLPPGNYWVAVSWYDTYGRQTLVSPLAPVQLTSTGSINISPPAAGAPANAIGMDVYIGMSTSSLTYQGHTTSTTATYVQSTALATGAALPTTNTTVCQVVANDAGWPTYTGYNMTISTPTGNALPGYPVLTQFLGPGSTYNFANGIPLYNGRIVYPTPIIAQPYNHNPQSISGPLAMGATGGQLYSIYNLLSLGIGTSTPAWGVDDEATGTLGAINANTGYLVDGAAGTAGQCLLSDGTYFDTPGNCLTSAPTVYYQTMGTTGHETFPQQPVLAFGPEFTLADATGETNVDLSTTGVTAGSYSCANLQVNSYGQLSSVANGSCAHIFQEVVLTSGICTTGTSAYAQCSNTVTWPTAFADTNYAAVCTAGNPTALALTAVWVTSKTTTGLSVTLQNGDSSGANAVSVSELDCFGYHP